MAGTRREMVIGGIRIVVAVSCENPDDPALAAAVAQVVAQAVDYNVLGPLRVSQCGAEIPAEMHGPCRAQAVDFDRGKV